MMGRQKVLEPGLEELCGCAFRKADVSPLEACLREIALKALAQHGGNTEAKEAAVWAEVREDPRLMVELFRHSWRDDVSALLRRVSGSILDAKRAGVLQRPVERVAAVAATAQAETEQRHEAEVEERLARDKRERDRFNYELFKARLASVGD